MTDSELSQQIAKRKRAIARFEEKAARCNTGTDLGRAVATRAEDSAKYHRKHLEKLQVLLQNPGVRVDLGVRVAEATVAMSVATRDCTDSETMTCMTTRPLG
jgi:hypothetical protein